jgi:aryl-alcohol dehydrogenase
MDIEAAVIRETSGVFSLEKLELDEPREDEVLVRIVGVGLCHTDLSCRDQMYPVPLPAVLGHEGSGVVAAIGSKVSKVQPGDHVVLSYRSCGDCRNCLAGDPSHCVNIFERNFSGTRDDGSCSLHTGEEPVHCNFFGQSSFASYALATQDNTVKVDPDLPLELLGPLGCGIQTGAGAVMNTLAPAAGSSIVIFGCGSVGLSALMAAVVVGCTSIIAVDINSQRLELARELGATATIDPNTSNPVERVLELTKGGADYSLECTALPEVFRQAVDSLSVTGVCALVGAAAMGTEVSLDMNSIMFGRTVKGVVEGESIPELFIPTLAELFRQGRFPMDKLVTFYPLHEINRAVQETEAGTTVKAVLLPGT